MDNNTGILDNQLEIEIKKKEVQNEYYEMELKQ